MRIAIVSATAKQNGIPGYIRALQKGMESMGHRVDVVDAWTEDGYKLPGYEYLAVVAEQISLFGGKMPESLLKIVATSGGGIGGKRSAAFLKKTYPFTSKGLSNLMKLMEKEGMLVNWSEVLLNDSHAEAMGKRIGV
ncbi:hypothetical protein FACS1894172_21730 [Spirochaetia bacterium]|nr:hypothetical protein FACS1894164_13080 [Spirochaetia bacterium]GHU38240.1 hypothetical protein FACS1894172_21730 [Spirochaetia bacterium]